MNSSAITIQKIVRGYLTRTAVMRSYRIRKRINPSILHLAEKYLQNGNLWKFLCEVNDEILRLRNEMDLNAIRENDMATTFVQHVTQFRQEQFDESWNAFSKEVDRVQGTTLLERMSGTSYTTKNVNKMESKGTDIVKKVIGQDILSFSALDVITRKKATHNKGIIIINHVILTITITITILNRNCP